MNSDHVRMSPKNQKFLCTHCGVYKPINPGLTSGLQDQIDAFTTAHAACPVLVFKSGDRVSFCGEEATVVSNYGDSGTVEIDGQGRMNWYWKFQGERVMPVVTPDPFKPGGFERVLQGFEQIGKEINGEKA